MKNELKRISNWFKKQTNKQKTNKQTNKQKKNKNKNKKTKTSKLNVDKTNFMIFRNKHNNKTDLHFRIEIDDKHIEKVEVSKFFGILMDNNLSWKSTLIIILKLFLNIMVLLEKSARS